MKSLLVLLGLASTLTFASETISYYACKAVVKVEVHSSIHIPGTYEGVKVLGQTIARVETKVVEKAFNLDNLNNPTCGVNDACLDLDTSRRLNTISEKTQLTSQAIFSNKSYILPGQYHYSCTQKTLIIPRNHVY